MTDVRSTRRLGTGAIVLIVLASCALLGAVLGLFGQRLGLGAGGRSAIMTIWLAFLTFFVILPRTRSTGARSRQ